MNHLPRRLGFVVTIAVLAACGGGGGGGGSTPPPTGQPPGGPSLGTLAIDDESAVVLPLSLSISESALQLARSAIDAVVPFAGPQGEALTSCTAGGTRQVTLLDNDGDLSISNGDVVQVAYDACDDRILADPGTGTLTITIADFSLTREAARASGTLAFEPGFTVTDANSGDVVTVTGSFSFDFTQDDGVALRVTATGSELLSLQFAEGIETITAFDINRVFAPGLITPGGTDFEGRVTITLDYDSGLLGGTVQCSGQTLDFTVNSLAPSFVDAECGGLNGSAVRIPDVTLIEVDELGNGGFLTLGSPDWLLIFEGFITDVMLFSLDLLVPELPFFSLQLAAVDIAEDPTRERLVLATSADDATFPARLVALDTATRALTEIATLPQTPRLVTLSDDGQYYYVAFEAPGAPIHRIDAATGALDAEIDFTTDFAPRNTVFPVAIDVSPADNRTIAVVLQSTQITSIDVLVIDDTTARPNSLFDLDGQLFVSTNLLSVAFTPAGDGLRISVDFLRTAELDAAGIVSSTQTRVGGGQLTRLGDELLAGGTLLDNETLVRRGRYAGGAPYRAIAADANAFLRIRADELVVESLDKFLPQGVFDLRAPIGAPTIGIAAAGDNAVIINGERVFVYSLADAPVQRDRRCEPSVVTTQQGADIDRITCFASDIAYDVVRNRLYIALQPREQGVVGNSVAVFDATTLTLIAYVPVGDSPRRLARASDDNALFVAFDEDDRIAVLDLLNLSVSDRLAVPIALPAFGSQDPEPRRVLELAASSIVPDGVAFSFASGSNAGFSGLGYFQGGALGGNVVDGDDLPPATRSASRRLDFDATGELAAIAVGIDVSLETYSADATGVVPTGTADYAGVDFFDTAVSRVGDEIFDATGRVLNTQTGAVTERFDLTQAGYGGFSDARVAVLADTASASAYFLFGDGITATVARFDLASGSFTGAATFEAVTGFSILYSPRIISAGGGRVGVFLSDTSGVAVIDAGAFQ